MSGPLNGLRVVELEGRGPAPFGAMILADLGAEVIRVGRVDRVYAQEGGDQSPAERLRYRKRDVLARGRRSVALDLKHPDGVACALRLIDQADVFIECLRPGALERRGMGPETCLRRNPRLVYARMTGWGQEGPYAQRSGHDLNFLALTGILDPLRPRVGEAPHPPLNLLGDYGGGGMLLVIGILSALFERAVSGKGQVVDASMLDGTALLTSILHGLRADGLWSDIPGTNLLDLGSPFYNVYETADGRYVALCSHEPHHRAELLKRLGLEDTDLATDADDPSRWPALQTLLADHFIKQPLSAWSAVLTEADVCFTPVFTLDEAPNAPHNVDRRTYVEVDGVVQPAPAPRFDRTQTGVPSPPVGTGENSSDVLLDWGFEAAEVTALLSCGAVADSSASPGTR